MSSHRSSAPIGVFDSGIGGLSVLQALIAELPNERFVYLADNADAPYGERSNAFVSRRTHTLARYLVQKHQVKALVLACNTATAAAVDSLRDRYPSVPLVGVEPAIKPAALSSHSGRIAVMATRSTVTSLRFARLLSAVPKTVQCRVQACDGLANAIEVEAALGEAMAESPRQYVTSLCKKYIDALGPFGDMAGAADTLVLGCTHYVFAQDVIEQVVGPGVRVLSTGEPVARQTRRLLTDAGLLRAEDSPAMNAQGVCLISTGSAEPLSRAAHRWLGLDWASKTLGRSPSKY